jgi:hypothetical protein
MQIYVLVAIAAATVANAIPAHFHNHCATSISLYNNTYTEEVASGCSTSRELEEGFSGMFRNGWNPQATRKFAGLERTGLKLMRWPLCSIAVAEFSVSWGFLWYDISVSLASSSAYGTSSSYLTLALRSYQPVRRAGYVKLRSRLASALGILTS